MPWIAEHLDLRIAATAIQQIRRHRLQLPPLARELQRRIPSQGGLKTAPPMSILIESSLRNRRKSSH
jgi:hypothetical protein